VIKEQQFEDFWRENKNKSACNGYLQIEVFKGLAIPENRIQTFCDKNLVVNKARELMTLLCSSVDADKPITNMRWGSGGHNPSTPTEAIPPSATDTALATPIVSPASKPVTITYPSVTSVKFSATLDQTEANGVGLSEEGLFNNDDDMWARKTFGIITKSSSWSLTFSHVLLF